MSVKSPPTPVCVWLDNHLTKTIGVGGDFTDMDGIVVACYYVT